MKKNSRLKSFFAILLAVSMIFQQSSLTVLATDDTYVEDATATPTPSESEAEAYATEGTEPVAEKQEEPQQMQETPAAEPAVVDVRAWYELIGQRILEAQITGLNANGHSKLTIKENGDIVINRQKKEVFVTALDSFPGKNYWDELVTILQENELNAKISGNALQVSWI